MKDVVLAVAVSAGLIFASAQGAAAETYFRSTNALTGGSISLPTGSVGVVSVVVPAGNWNVDSKVVIEDGSHAANGSVVQCWLIANGTVLTLVDTAEIGGAATNGKSVLSQIINSGSFTTGRSTGIELSCGQVANIGPNVSVISSSLRVTPAGAFK